MPRVRLSFAASDRAKALLAARKARAALAAQKLLRPENIDIQGRVYFDVEGDPLLLGELARREVGRKARVDAVEAPESTQEPEECINCENIPDQPVAKCPACDFVEVSACPSCHAPVPRTAYISVAASSIYQCPRCDARVTLRFADPLFDDNGRYHQPVVEVVALALAAGGASCSTSTAT